MYFNPHSNNLPKRSELPHIPGTPEGSAWLWGQDDELGRLNLLTPERRAAAAKLIQTGETVSLNWSAELPNPPMFGREPFKHAIKSLGPAGNDELLALNSQSGSQWDGFRHASFFHNGRWVFYNNTTPEQVEKTTRCGVQAWSTRGIVGRGVLLDYWNFSGKSYDVNTRHPISADDLKACAKAQGVKFQYGDILLVRTGWIETYNSMSQEERVKLSQVPAFQHTFVGVDQHPDVADFLHDNYFSVVASDTPAFEVWPQIKEWNHHNNLLPLWGVPIGELWDLEMLAEVCRERKQYEFFFASTPMNVKGEFDVMAHEVSD
ncbi:putative cyclase-domain-containing protein [Dactylonectria macrodidyma]|uniref:Cyclase-domain-containing protein n=1 Tax=Dactylonectria macrodidyma TaxID=307937 RepID=A0A9P9J5G5_9HYPO|nr:putative cyclase-domain-containing protein [Dactylonectria macrodidyma]